MRIADVLAEESISRNKTMRQIRLIIAALCMLAPISVLADIIVYHDRGDFESDSGSIGIGAIPQGVNPATFSLGGLTFTQNAPSSLNTSRNWSTLISEDYDLAINGMEGFNVDSPDLLYAFGFDFHEPNVAAPTFPDTCNATCFDSTFELTLLSGGLSVGSFTFNGPDAQLWFVGVASTVGFDRVQLREIVGNIDNEFFGNFLISRTPVPEPGTLALLGIGLLGMGAARRRKTV